MSDTANITKQIQEEKDPKKKAMLTRRLESAQKTARNTTLAKKLVEGLLDETAAQIKAAKAPAAAPAA